LQDVKERAHWPAYSRAFEEAINATSKENAPWFVIPADDKKVMRAMVTQIVREELEKLPITWPRSHSDIEQDISEGRRMLSAD
jgi:polyphosphate kinase 2 (PPK2 family)